MARGRHRQREDGGVDPDGAAGPRLWSPHFFKIILPDTLESGKLGIPKKFLGRYGKDLSSLVLLEVLGSSTWSMGVEKLNNSTVWLWKGWQEFMRHYSIGHGHLIVFKYKGNSTFRVMIFDKSASEIDYSLSSISNLGSGFILPKREDVIEVEDSEDFAPCQKKKGRPTFTMFSAESKLLITRSQSLLARLNKGMLPQSFFINHGLFKYACGQNVPRWFIRQHIQQIMEIVTLRHSNRTWPLKLRNYPSGLMQFSSGWIAFVRGTHLRVGNVCVFELINRDDIVFRVYIFSSAGRNKESQCRMNRSEPVFCDPTPSRPLTTPELAGEFDSEHPFFKLVIQQSHFKKMHVPGQFVRQHIQENKKEGTLRYSDRSWPVKLSRYTRGIRVFFSAGWRAFARETHLCEGNVCVFELIDRDDVVFKVSIFSSGGKDQIHID